MGLLYHFILSKSNIQKNQKRTKNEGAFCQVNEILFEIGIVGFWKLWYNTL